jgi:large subunit ribosomal protein L2
MGKRIIQQARGHGSFSYRVKRKAFTIKLKYPNKIEGEGIVQELLNSKAHSAPIAKIKNDNNYFYVPAVKGLIEKQKINFELKEDQTPNNGDILRLKDIPIKSLVCDIESRPGDGGVFIKTAGSSATITKKINNKVYILMPSKKEKAFNENCRAIVGIVAGSGRLDKPLVKAGKNFYIKKAKNKLWPRTSAVKMNVIDHPFGSGRGKRIKSKIAKRNAPAGAKVGLIRPSRTGRKKR